MKYIDLEGHTHKVHDIDRYRHIYEDFYEKSIYRASINRGRTITAQGAHAGLLRILSFLLFRSW